jgi:hypothetical protein
MIYKKMKNLPPFLYTQQLRDVYAAAEIYALATNNYTMFDSLKVALEFAENIEPEDSYSKCVVCGRRIPKFDFHGRKKSYCGFDCAETDGAIDK